jgi:hypothetical protein
MTTTVALGWGGGRGSLGADDAGPSEAGGRGASAVVIDR